LKRLLQNITSIAAFPFWAILLVQALVWSRFLLSASLWGISAIGLVFFFKPRYMFTWDLWWNWDKVFEKKVYLILTIPFFTVLISGLWSEDLVYWLSRVRIRLPYLVLPIALMFLPPISKKQFLSLLYVFLITISINMSVVLINFAFHSELIIQHLGQGIPMPFLKAHIVYSLMAAFAVMVGWELWTVRFYVLSPIESKYILGMTIFLFIGMHIISVRSGLMALYICLFVKSLLFIFKYKKRSLGFYGLALIVCLPLVAYFTLPSLQNRINYTIWDLKHYAENQSFQKSDSERIISLRMAWQIVKQNPILGVGSGDLMNAISTEYATQYPNFKVKEPHNNFLFVWLSTGLLGLIAFLFSFAYPLFYKKNYKNDLFLLLHTVMLVSFSVDYIVEGTFGTFFYIFFVCLFLKFFELSDETYSQKFEKFRSQQVSRYFLKSVKEMFSEN
jgi:O-antigen ligase